MKSKFCFALSAITALAALTLGTTAQAQSQGSWLVRGGITQLAPQVTSGNLSAPSLTGVQSGVSNSTQLSGGITNMLRILALAEAHGVPVTGAGGFEAANLPVMAGHDHGGMLEVHGAHIAIKARFATHPEFCNGTLLVPATAGLGFSLKP
jgi:hypothetical protein